MHMTTITLSVTLKFCFEMLQATESVLIDEDDPSRGPVRIRIGIASGPVTATVIGTRNRK